MYLSYETGKAAGDLVYSTVSLIKSSIKTHRNTCEDTPTNDPADIVKTGKETIIKWIKEHKKEAITVGVKRKRQQPKLMP